LKVDDDWERRLLGKYLRTELCSVPLLRLLTGQSGLGMTKAGMGVEEIMEIMAEA
jgi:hypothetical protein